MCCFFAHDSIVMHADDCGGMVTSINNVCDVYSAFIVSFMSFDAVSSSSTMLLERYSGLFIVSHFSLALAWLLSILSMQAPLNCMILSSLIFTISVLILCR